MSEDAGSERAVPDPFYADLADSVGTMAHLPNGASYHSGEQVITHLNRVLGPAHWSFRVLDIGEESDSDECWAFGEITASINGVSVVKQDYGSQAFKRAKSTGNYISKWDDKKAAATDALKRCARLLGVGLDAWANERAPSWRPEQAEDAPGNVPAGSGPRPMPSSGSGGDDLEPYYCEECQEPLTATNFKDGTTWEPSQLAVFGRRKHSRILCMSHYREANQAKRRAEEALQQVTF